MAKKKTKGLPKQVFVQQQVGNTGDTYLIADDDMESAAELGSVRRVGRYVLVEEFDLSAKAVVSNLITKNIVVAPGKK